MTEDGIKETIQVTPKTRGDGKIKRETTEGTISFQEKALKITVNNKRIFLYFQRF